VSARALRPGSSAGARVAMVDAKSPAAGPLRPCTRFAKPSNCSGCARGGDGSLEVSGA
jgi:hypothetical protein